MDVGYLLGLGYSGAELIAVNCAEYLAKYMCSERTFEKEFRFVRKGKRLIVNVEMSVEEVDNGSY